MSILNIISLIKLPDTKLCYFKITCCIQTLNNIDSIYMKLGTRFEYIPHPRQTIYQDGEIVISKQITVK